MTVPALELPVDLAGWHRSAMLWRGWDGSEWRITDPAGGVFVPREGIRGLTMPPMQRYSSESPAVAGSRHRGHRVQDRECFWPLMVYSDASSVHWGEIDRAFWKTMRPDKTGTWIFEQPDGTRRYLDCRFVDDGDAQIDKDPFFFGWQVYGVTLLAEQPMWRGQRISRLWGEAANVAFFAGETVTISPGSQVLSAYIDNPGDIAAQMIWTLKGSFTDAIVGQGGKTIEIPYAQTSDRKLVIDTRPDRLTAYEYAYTDDALTGAYIDRTDDLGTADFGSIEPGEEVSLDITLTSPGLETRVTGDLDPLYYRAW